MCILQYIFDTHKNRGWKFTFRSVRSGRIAHREKLKCFQVSCTYQENKHDLECKIMSEVKCIFLPNYFSYIDLFPNASKLSILCAILKRNKC